MVDIRIEYQDRPYAYVEVIIDIDPGYAAMLDWLKKLGRTATGYQIPPVLPMSTLRHAWYLTLSGRTYQHGRTLLDELERLLRQLEADGQLFELIAPIEKLRTVEHESVKRLMHLGVVSVGSGPGTGAATLSPDGIVGPAEPSSQAFVSWLSSKLAGESGVRKKLAATGAAERHVFVATTFTSLPEVYFARLNAGTAPLAAPTLPHEISHVWVWNAEGGETVLAWFPERGWFEPSKEWATP
jgi:hypothetical protein